MESGSNKVLDSRRSGETRVKTTDSCVSISLNDSWTGRKLLESFGYDYNSYMPSEEFNVRNLKCKFLTVFSPFCFRFSLERVGLE